MSTTFAQLGVPQDVCDALERRGITDAFEIQAATIADALAGRDVCGRAPTGSGKTLAFGVPMIATVGTGSPRRPRGLILAPTRELADQITSELRSFAGSVRVHTVYGGVGYGAQRTALRNGVDVLVACPGRLEDLIGEGSVTLADVDHVVLDEADRMADMGFIPAVRRLLDQTSSDRQTVLFSATLDGDVATLTREYQSNPARHEVGDATPDITAATHTFWMVDKADRAATTAAAIDAVWPAIVFCRTRHGADRLAKQLGRAGIAAAAIHGGRSQSQRTRALTAFADNKVQALVATDVAARGIHVDGLSLVVHYDPPEDHKAYVHRSGRTARAGEGGVVVSLVQPDQRRDLERVQRKVGLSEPFDAPNVGALHGLVPVPTAPRPEVREDAPRSEQKPHSGGRNASANKNASKQRRRRGQGGAMSKSDRRKASAATHQAKKKASTKAGSNRASNGTSQPKPNNRKARRAHLQPK